MNNNLAPSFKAFLNSSDNLNEARDVANPATN